MSKKKTTRFHCYAWMDSGAIDAVLPDLPAKPGWVMIYSVPDGHSEGMPGYWKNPGCRPATEEEVATAAAALLEAGYPNPVHIKN